MKNTKNAFTLTEILLGMTIIGTIATLSIPRVINKFNEKMFITQLKSTIVTINQLVDSQKTLFGTPKSLELTDFNNNIEKLAEEFNVFKSCKTSSGLATYCKASYKSIDGTALTFAAEKPDFAVMTKDGTIIAYQATPNSSTMGIFAIDLNGTDKPNVAGKDYFSFYLNPDGTLSGDTISTDPEKTEEQKAQEDELLNAELSKIKENCKKGITGQCYKAVMANNWSMDY